MSRETNLLNELHHVKSTTVGAVLTSMVSSGLNACTYTFTPDMSTAEKQSYINGALRLNTSNSAGVIFEFKNCLYEEDEVLIFENFTYPIQITGCKTDDTNLDEEDLKCPEVHLKFDATHLHCGLHIHNCASVRIDNIEFKTEESIEFHEAISILNCHVEISDCTFNINGENSSAIHLDSSFVTVRDSVFTNDSGEQPFCDIIAVNTSNLAVTGCTSTEDRTPSLYNILNRSSNTFTKECNLSRVIAEAIIDAGVHTS